MRRAKRAGAPPVSLDSPILNVALIGNPNTGKSTLFGRLVGVRQRVGNYPGVTVEKKTGEMEFAGRQYDVVDLPGLYSLAPRSRDEMVAVDLLLGRLQATRRRSTPSCASSTPPTCTAVCIWSARCSNWACRRSWP